jgi:hypothetical protein
MTKLPNAADARVPLAKLTNYLLSLSHPVGGAKAKFFRRLGFDESTVLELKRGLIAIATSQPVSESVTSVHGTKYIVDGNLDAPGGTRVQVRTVWIVEPGEDHPRFVTAYPFRKESEEP